MTWAYILECKECLSTTNSFVVHLHPLHYGVSDTQIADVAGCNFCSSIYFVENINELGLC